MAWGPVIGEVGWWRGRSQERLGGVGGKKCQMPADVK